MIRKINRIMALVLIATSVVTTASVTPFNKIANADSTTSTSSSTSPTDEQIYALIKSNLDTMYAAQNCIVLSSSTPVYSIPLVISSDTATKMASFIVTDSFIKKQLVAQGVPESMITQTMIDTAKPVVTQAVVAQLESLDGQSVPVYAYKAIDKTDGTTVKDQGYFLGGKVGYLLMQQQGSPIVVSSAQLDSTTIGALINQIKDKIIAMEQSANDLIKNGNDLINKANDLINKAGGLADQIGNSVTNTANSISDSMNDLTDSLKDKNDDVNNAWDKVFNRFDNEPGWGKKDGYIYYYDKDGVSLKGVQEIDGKTYYFNRIDGAMETGWQIVDGKRCYFDKKRGYEIFNQWVKDGDDYYFVGTDGTVIKMDWVNDKGKKYYLKADGKMTTGWLKVEDTWYYFNKDGSMATSSWAWSKGKWYYLRDNGYITTGWLQLGDKKYYFKDPSGEMQTGWFRADGNWYCTNDDGSIKTGWASSKNSWCYLDDATGIMKKNEWVTVDGKSYYFNINGEMVTGSRYIDGTKYVFNSDGTLSA